MAKKIIEECIVVGGVASGGHVLGKNRDRNYSPRLEIIRDIMDGVEVAYIHDLDTGYLEGMNAAGLGMVNAALLVGKDEKEVKGKIQSDDGPRMMNALKYTKLSDMIKSLISHMDGIKGHTIVGSPKSMYSIEMTSETNPVVKKLNPATGFDVRANHGEEHPDAGYTPQRQPDDYMSSKIRKATAQVQLANVEDHEKVMPALAQQHFEPDSNFNMLRATNNMKTTNQVLMHLDKKEMIVYIVPGQCRYQGMIDKCPEGYDHAIKIRVMEYPEGKF